MPPCRPLFDWYASDESKVIRDDEDKFFDRNRMVVLLTNEKVMKG
jgi:hypothetical protein